MKVFVTGVGGQLGSDVLNELRRRGHEAVGADLVGSTDVQLDSQMWNYTCEPLPKMNLWQKS